MNKVAAEIIAGVIPRKMARNRWRGILRFGLWNAIKLKWRLRKETSTPDTYLAVCAIAKNEGPYFKEWIEWHRKKGVEKFYIYDNDSTDDTKYILAPYIENGIVEYKYFPGSKMQLAAYDNCFESHRLDTRWIAIIDIDEFIVPIKYKTIPDFLRLLEKYSSVEINWLIYGSGGAKTKEPGGVMERFKYHSKPDHILNRHVKSIVDPRRVCTMTGCHEAARLEGNAADSHGNKLRKGFRDRKPIHDTIRINHYAVKSYEEFIQKRARGRARKNTQRDLSYFDQYNLNDITED